MPKPIAEQGNDLRLAVFRLARRLRAHHTDDGLSDGQFVVLVTLHLHGPHTLTELAERERVSAPSMNRTVNCLEERGLLVREPDGDDRRKSNIRLTEAGTSLVTATVRKRDAWLTEQLGELSDEERVIVARAAEIMAGLAHR